MQAAGKEETAGDCPPPPTAAGASRYGITSPETMPLVAAANFARVFDDGKTVVDRPLRAPPAEVAAAFAQLSLPSPLEDPDGFKQHRDQVAAFLQEWTEEEGSDMETLEASIPGPPPGWLPIVTHPEARHWAHQLHSLWGALGRKLSPAVRLHPELHTMLWVPHPFVVPGARFREVYYWDSYWVIKGLLVSQLTHIAQGIIDNMIYLIETYGHVPNGIRSYYLNRSQPPLLSEMVRLVHAAAPDVPRLARALRALLTEHAYWTRAQGDAPKQVTVLDPDGKQYLMVRYCANWHAARPESYREDIETARAAGLGEAGRRQLWQELASGAESGWDYSSRWFHDGTTLPSIRTTRIIPADLNAFLYQMEVNIAAFAEELEQSEVAARFCQLALDRRAAINALMWDAPGGQWRDLILEDPSAGSSGSEGAVHAVGQSSVTAASNWVPLFGGLAERGSTQAAQAVQALQKSGLVQVGGLAATTVTTGQQWDFPNVWPPLVDMAVVGAEKYGGQAGAELAAQLAQSYLRTAFTAWRETGNMFEKFNAQRVGAAGGGGEYEVVAGFGWSNGVALSLLQKYGWQE